MDPETVVKAVGYAFFAIGAYFTWKSQKPTQPQMRVEEAEEPTDKAG